MNLLIALLIAILGLTIGSFLSVVIYRLKSKTKGILLGKSICPHCKKELKWRHLVPVFSWLFLRGRCAYCQKPISAHYLATELLTAITFLAIFLNWNFLETVPSIVDPNFLNYGISWPIFEIFIFYLIEASFLIVIFFYDLLHKEIPDILSLPAIVLAIAGGLFLNLVQPLAMLIGGLSIGLFFALQFILSRGAWIGGGDIRLGILMGILLGWEKGVLALIIAYVVGAIFSLILIAQKKATRKTVIPFGPFLIAGTFIALFFGEKILAWYL